MHAHRVRRPRQVDEKFRLLPETREEGETMSQMAKTQIAYLRGLRAVRSFRAEPVSPDALRDILDVARWSGSASNRQPWAFIVITERATLDALSQMGYAGHLASAPLAIAIVMEGEEGRDEHEIWDEGRLTERIMLAAHAHGLGSCIGWLQGDGINDAKKLLGVPAERRLRTIISIGLVDEGTHLARPKPPQARKPLADLVHRERW
jgi:nitroreductase